MMKRAVNLNDSADVMGGKPLRLMFILIAYTGPHCSHSNSKLLSDRSNKC